MPYYLVSDTKGGEAVVVEARRVETAINHVVAGRFRAERIDLLRAADAESQPAREVDLNMPLEGE